MELRCPACAAETSVPDDALPPEGARARCHACGVVSMFYRGGLVDDDPTPERGLPATPWQGPTPVAPVIPGAAIPFAASRAQPPPAPEPLVAGPAKSIGWQVRTAAGDQGPLPIEALKPMIRDGRFGPDDLACPPGATEWTRAGDVADLKRWFALQKTAAPAAQKGAPADTVASCTQHPGVRGRWMCQGCGNLSCDACVVEATMGMVKVKQCGACRKVCTEFVPSKKITPFWEDLQQVFTYPVRGLGWVALITFPLMGIFAQFAKAGASAFALAWGGYAFLVLTIYAYHLYIIRDTTRGGRRMPNLGNVSDYREEFLKPASKASFVSVLLFWPVMWASSGVGGAKMTLGMAEGYRAEILADKAAYEKYRDLPEEQQKAADEAAAKAFESALSDLSTAGSADEQDFGHVIGQAFGSMSGSHERDYDQELREAQAAIDEAKSRLLTKQLIRGALLVVALGIWPIVLIIIALFNTILPVFQPQVLMKLIAEIPREYGWCAAITAGCFLGIFALQAFGLVLFHTWLTNPATYYLSCIAFHVMGRTAELAEQKIDWH